MAKLITEYSQDFQITEEINEKSKEKEMFAVGIFSSAEIENNNKRKYKKDILEREIIKVNEKIEKKCLWGELGHPPNPEVNPDKIALGEKDLSLEESIVWLNDKNKMIDTTWLGMGNASRNIIEILKTVL